MAENSEQLRNNVNIPSGISQNSEDAAEALNNAVMQKDLLMGKAPDMPSALGMGFMGGAAGAQAAQGTTNPFVAAIQGVAAGMQVSAAIWKQKRDELKTALDAAPAIQTMPDVVNKPGYEIFQSWPTKIVQQVLATVGQDAIRLKMDADYKKKLATIETPEEAQAYSKLAAKAGLMMTPEDFIGVRKSDIADIAKIAASESGQEKKQSVSDIKQRNLDEKMFDLLSRKVNPNVAVRGSALGVAAINNQRADRAIDRLLNKDGWTIQDKSMVVQDIAGLIQGGVPHEEEIRQQGYGTYLDTFTNIANKAAQDPRVLNQPEIRKRLLDSVIALKQVDNKVIIDNLNTQEAMYSGVISRNPAQWNRVRASIEGSLESPAEKRYREKGLEPVAGETNDMIRVKRISDGVMGRISASKFDPSKYQRIQ